MLRTKIWYLIRKRKRRKKDWTVNMKETVDGTERFVSSDGEIKWGFVSRNVTTWRARLKNYFQFDHTHGRNRCHVCIVGLGSSSAENSGDFDG